MRHRHNELIARFKESGQKFESETIETADNHLLTIFFFEHASLGFVWDDKVMYLDPLMEYADYSRLPKADAVFVTHEHYDHLDKAAIETLRKDDTVVVGSAGVGMETQDVQVMKPGDTLQVMPGISVLATRAYNTTEGHLQFHPRDRGDNGYLLTLDKTTVYFAGDTEFIPEMKQLGHIDIAFLPVNQPYTMTLEQASRAVRAIMPGIFFPYHTTDTQIDKLGPMLADLPQVSVRIHKMP